MPSERRFLYRGTLGDEAIRAEVSGESGQASGDVLEDLSLKGTAVRIALKQDPTFFIGEKVTLNLHFKQTRSIQVPATVRARTELDEFRRFRLAFLEPSALRAKLTSGLLRLFNERDAFRVEPDVAVYVTLEIPGMGFQTSGRMRDVSANGLGALIDGDAEKRLSRVVRVSVEFTPPGQNRPVTFQASIRNRYKLDDKEAVCIGLCFDPERSSDFVSQQRNLTDYIMMRQRELLQARVET